MSSAAKPAASALRVTLLTLLALAGFASNSVLCRLALRDGLMDPASFTGLRIVSGAVVLALILKLRGRRFGGDWISALALMIYAIGFSFAYVSIPAGIGALLLFGAVQVTMIGTGLVNGERPYWHEWTGEAISLAGLVALLWPGLSAPPLQGALLMLAAGIAWACYSLRGRCNTDSTAATAGNFLRAAPIALAIAGLAAGLGLPAKVSLPGLVYALLSGAFASGLGYAVWYTVLPSLSAIRAGLVQLAVPVLVAAIGLLFLGEQASPRLLICALLILGGLALATLYRRPASRRR
ncbi:MAG: DMT family transporter [Nevskia sp.]